MKYCPKCSQPTGEYAGMIKAVDSSGKTKLVRVYECSNCGHRFYPKAAGEK